MADLSIIIGMGIGSSLLLLLAHILGQQKDSSGNLKQPWLRLMVIFFFLFSLLFIPSELIKSEDYCEILLANRTITNQCEIVHNHTNVQGGDSTLSYMLQCFNESGMQLNGQENVTREQLQYDRVCFENTNTTSVNYYEYMVWFIRIFLFLIIITFLIKGFQMTMDAIKSRQ